MGMKTKQTQDAESAGRSSPLNRSNSTIKTVRNAITNYFVPGGHHHSDKSNGTNDMEEVPRNERDLSPNELTWLDEKNALIGLNDRLAIIIERNRELESENAKLRQDVNTSEVTMVTRTDGLKRTFESERESLRKTLEAAEKDKVKSKLSEANMKQQLADAHAKVHKHEKEISELTKKLKDAEGKSIAHDAEMKRGKEEVTKFSKHNHELGEENKQLHEENKGLKKSHEHAQLTIVELQNAVRGKGEELHLKTQIHEQEVSVIRTTSVSKLQEIGGKLQKEYDSQLGEIIKALRGECEREIKKNKELQDKLYFLKEEELKGQLHNLRHALFERSDEAGGLRLKLKEFDNRLNKLEGERHALLQKVQGAEDAALDTEARMIKELKDLERLLALTQEEKMTLINEYQGLMQVKVALDNEILTYRKLLEGEEKRLAISIGALHKTLEKELEEQIFVAIN